MSAMALLVGLGWLGLEVGADMWQPAMRAELRNAFAGTTATDMVRRMGTDDGYAGLPATVTKRPMYLGRVGETDEFEGRYAVQSFGAYRCVDVRCKTAGFTLRDASGAECAGFPDRPPSA